MNEILYVILFVIILFILLIYIIYSVTKYITNTIKLSNNKNTSYKLKNNIRKLEIYDNIENFKNIKKFNEKHIKDMNIELDIFKL